VVTVDTRTRDQAEALESLIFRVAEGDPDAVAALYDSTSRLIYGLILRILRNVETAEEVLLDVYTQVWRQAHLYDRSRGSLLAWMSIIARTRAINRLRRGDQEQQLSTHIDMANEVEATSANPEDASLISERGGLVRSALELLSAEQREVIELAYYSGMSHSEIAAELGHPLGTVKTRIRLGMMRLREQLKQSLEVEQ
jgi:RNA polymerase sigma-70 factor, ECF subfamily